MAVAGTLPVKEFEDSNMYANWSVDPLLVAAHSAKFAGCQMAATLLSTDQVGAARSAVMVTGHHSNNTPANSIRTKLPAH